MRTRALLRRGTAHRAVLAAVFATVLLTLTVATAVALLHRAANDAAVTEVLTDATAADRAVVVAAELEDDTGLAALDERVRESLESALAPAEPVVRFRAVSASHSLPSVDPDEPDLTVFASYGDDLTEAADLVDGAWPSTGSAGRVEVALPRPAAERLDLSPGDRWTVLNRFTDEPVDVELTAVFVVEDPEAPAWLDDPLLTRGVATGTFTTYGPLVVAPTVFTDRFLEEATGTWTADPQLGAAAPDELAELRSGVAGLEEDLADEAITVESDLADVLDRVDTPLTATRATVVLGAAPLVLLGVAALLTAGRLLRDRRRVELALLRARGASTAQLGAVALVEALALTLPAVLLAPLAARLLVTTWGPDAVSGGGVPGLDGTAWLVAALAGAAAALTLVLPSWRSEGLAVAVRSAGAGPRRAAQRVGADVLVLVAAVVAAWQLARYDGPLRAGKVDPLLVVAPALLLLAGCLVMLRALPLALAVAQPLASRSRGLTGALAAWTVSRQLGRQVGPVLAVLLSASVVAFSLTWLASWDRSAEDQAAFTNGADVRVQDPSRSLSSSALSDLAGVEAATPVARSEDSFGDARAELLAMDVAVADDVLRLRDDLADRPLSALLAPLAEASAPAGLPLPEGTAALELRDPAGGTAGERLAVVQDGTGMLHAFRFDRGDTGGRLTAQLGALPGASTLLGIQSRTAASGAPTADPVLRPVDASGRRGERLALPEGVDWERGPATSGRSLLLVGELGSGRLPVVVTRGLAETVGDQSLVADANGLSLRLEVVGVVEGLPSVDPGETEGVVVDLTAMNQAVLVQTGTLPTSELEWWLDVEGDPAAVGEAVADLAGGDSGVTVVDRESRLDLVESGPVGTAVAGVLAVALVTAGLTALSGIAASAGALGPARRREAALLRAIGAAPRQVARLAALDRAGLLGVAGASGVAVGLVVAWWTLPRIALTDSATAPYPPLVVEVPWTLLALGAAAVLAAGLVVHAWSRRAGAATGVAGRGEELP